MEITEIINRGESLEIIVDKRVAVYTDLESFMLFERVFGSVKGAKDKERMENRVSKDERLEVGKFILESKRILLDYLHI